LIAVQMRNPGRGVLAGVSGSVDVGRNGCTVQLGEATVKRYSVDNRPAVQ